MTISDKINVVLIFILAIFIVNITYKNFVLKPQYIESNNALIKSLNAPRLTLDLIDETIISEQYYVFPDTTLTICRLELRNGFSVTGESAAVSMDNFDEEIGRKVARENARDKIWALEGYLLKEKLFKLSNTK